MTEPDSNARTTLGQANRQYRPSLTSMPIPFQSTTPMLAPVITSTDKETLEAIRHIIRDELARHAGIHFFVLMHLAHVKDALQADVLQGETLEHVRQWVQEVMEELG